MSKDARKALMIAKGQVSNGYLPPGHPERGQNFKDWFGGSHVVDENGAPKRVYHGTNADIATFLKDKRGSSTGAKSAALGHWFTSDPEVATSYAHHSALSAPVHDLVKKSEMAEKRKDWDGSHNYIAQAEALEKELNDPANRMRGQNLIPAYLSLKNPHIIDAGGEVYSALENGITSQIQRAKLRGNDGVIIKNLDDAAGFSNRPADHYLVFDPTQIKSATGNNGQYDPSNPDITKAEGGEVDVQYDNPGGNWLKHQRENAEATVQKRGNIGAAGALTAWSKPVHVDPAKLSKIPGSMNERPEPGNAKYDALHKSMSAEGYSNKSPLLVGINHRGEPHIIEGNNRAAVARDLGVKSIPVEFRWFAGGEQADGFKPEHIKSLMPDIAKAEGGAVEETVPEAPHTLESQLQAFLQGKRKAVLYTHDEPELPKGAGRLETAHGVFHYNPALIDEPAIKDAVAGDRINDVLGIGPYSKRDVLNRVVHGESPLAVVGRDAGGREVLSAAGTDKTAPEQAAAIAPQLPPGGQVSAESPANVLFERIAAMRSPEQGNKDTRKALMVSKARGGSAEAAQAIPQAKGTPQQIEQALKLTSNSGATLPAAVFLARQHQRRD